MEDKKSLTKVKKIKDEWSKQHNVHALKRAEKLTKLVCDLQKHGGPCATAEDVDKLSPTLSDDPKKLQALDIQCTRSVHCSSSVRLT